MERRRALLLQQAALAARKGGVTAAKSNCGEAAAVGTSPVRCGVGQGRKVTVKKWERIKDYAFDKRVPRAV
jgi:hypothetical protein